MAVSPIATFINHDLHNKFGVLRTSTGLVEMLAEQASPELREKLMQQATQINQTLDRLSAAVLNITDCLNLDILSDKDQGMDISYQAERYSKFLNKNGYTSTYATGFQEVDIHEDKFAFIMDTVIAVAQQLSHPGAQIDLLREGQHLLVVFPEGNEQLRSAYRNLKELLNGHIKPEAVPHYFNIFFANYLLKKKGGAVQLEYVEPGKMGLLLDLGN